MRVALPVSSSEQEWRIAFCVPDGATANVRHQSLIGGMSVSSQRGLDVIRFVRTWSGTASGPGFPASAPGVLAVGGVYASSERPFVFSESFAGPETGFDVVRVVDNNGVPVTFNDADDFDAWLPNSSWPTYNTAQTFTVDYN